jgi:histone-lysine N-methyltransferase SETD1
MAAETFAVHLDGSVMVVEWGGVVGRGRSGSAKGEGWPRRTLPLFQNQNPMAASAAATLAAQRFLHWQTVADAQADALAACLDDVLARGGAGASTRPPPAPPHAWPAHWPTLPRPTGASRSEPVRRLAPRLKPRPPLPAPAAPPLGAAYTPAEWQAKQRGGPAVSLAPPVSGLAVRRSRVAGLGLYTCTSIPAGAIVCEYVGESVRHAVADAREAHYRAAGDHIFLFAASPSLVLDATRAGNAARFANHSCAPNCEAVGDVSRRRVALQARRRLVEGEEVTYDYHLTAPDADEQRIACVCGSAWCRGWV